MQLSPKDQKRLTLNDQLGRTSTLFEAWQPCMRVMRLANRRSANRYQDQKGQYTESVQLLIPILREALIESSF